MDPEQIEDVSRRRGILLMVRFGSSATGLEHPRSDVDLGVLLERVPESLSDQADLIGDLQSLVPGREVDIAILNRADPLLLKRVMDDAVLVHGSPRRFQALKLYAFRRHQDHQRFLRMEREYVDRMISAFGP